MPSAAHDQYLLPLLEDALEIETAHQKLRTGTVGRQWGSRSAEPGYARLRRQVSSNVRLPMRDISREPHFDIADAANKRRLLRQAIAELENSPDMGFVVLHMIAAFIDGLASGRVDGTKRAYLAYMQANFPQLCQGIGAETFYSQVRCKAVHEFALAPPLALAHSRMLQDPSAFVESVTKDGRQWTLVNLQRVVAEFVRHLDALDAVGDDARATQQAAAGREPRDHVTARSAPTAWGSRLSGKRLSRQRDWEAERAGSS